MKTIKVSLMMIVLLFTPIVVNSEDVLLIKLGIEMCLSPNALGCLHYQENTIYIREGLNDIAINYVLAHEIGHWYMRDMSYSEYQGIFGQGTYRELAEIAANKFSSYIWTPFILNQKEIRFFNELVMNNPMPKLRIK